MNALQILVSPVIGIAAYIAFALAYAHVRRREWMHVAGMAIVGIMLAAGFVNLIAKAL